ncbi:MAG: flagellar biosynthesis regulator FlhF [Rhizobiales bacterium 32-66-8]|nr:MAG: flagellar biosynthesis regulator FlhF [Rhizobiales bacterium 32-66-8]
MYKFSYAEILEESGAINRERERLALDHAIELMQLADAAGPRSKEVYTAVDYVQKLWSFFIKDLADPHNELAENLRVNLVSIGLWVMSETDHIVHERSKNFTGLIDVTRAIRDGLR